MNKSTEVGELGSEGGPTWTESTHTVSEAKAARLMGDVEKFVADSVVDPAERHQLKLVQRRRSRRAS